MRAKHANNFRSMEGTNIMVGGLKILGMGGQVSMGGTTLGWGGEGPPPYPPPHTGQP